jgi:hypothetical protein
LLKEFLGNNKAGALSRASDFKLPQGIAKETLEIYKEVATRVVQRGPGAPGFELQQLRLQLVEKALAALK